MMNIREGGQVNGLMGEWMDGGWVSRQVSG